MEITKNGLYGGAVPFSYQDADGWVYYSYVGGINDNEFGTYVYRYKDGVNERVNVEYFSKMRGSMSLEANGLWLTLFRNDERAIIRIPVPGFKMPGYPSNGQTGPALPSSAGTGVDTEARARVATLENRVGNLEAIVKRETDNLWNATIDDRKVVAALAERVANTASGGLSREEVEAIAWQKGLDSQYWTITNDSDNRRALIQLIVDNTVGGAELPNDIKELITDEVDTAIQKIVTKVLVALQPAT